MLYAYAHSGDLADFIPAFTTQNYLRTTINLTVVVGDAENVSAVIGEYVGYVTTEEFDEHKNDTTNPHRVTAAQVGLGNVPNVATNDQQPTFSAANSVAEINSGESLSLLLGKIKTAIAALISHFNANNPHNVTKAQVGLGNVPNLSTNDQTPTYTEASTLSDLTSGENLGAAFGKIKKAISSLISHLSNTSNPHNVTAQQAGASAVGHSHTTSDITSGTLPVERGGTGKTSIADIVDSLWSTIKGKADAVYAALSHTHALSDVSGISLNTTATNIKMNGTQSAGSGTSVAKANHVHPTDTSRAAANHTHSLSDVTGISLNSTASNIMMNGTQSAGSGTAVALANHVHPVDTSRAASTHSHSAATTSANGFMSSTDKTKLGKMQAGHFTMNDGVKVTLSQSMGNANYAVALMPVGDSFISGDFFSECVPFVYDRTATSFYVKGGKAGEGYSYIAIPY